MITSEQIRMARGALDWTLVDLEAQCGVSERTIRRIEAGSGVPKSTKANLLAIRHAFERAGIEFVGTPDDRPGVRLATSSG